MRIQAIYAIINIVNDKMYIGSAINLRIRWNNHKSQLSLNNHDNAHLQQSYNIYGNDAFIFVILERLKESSKLVEREQIWIDRLQTTNPDLGYNLRKIAKNNFGFRHTDEAKAKMGKNKKGIPRTEEVKRKISEINKGRITSDETKLKQSLIKRGKLKSEETKSKMSLAAIGKPKSEQAKLNMRKPKSEEHKRNLSIAKRELHARRKQLSTII